MGGRSRLRELGYSIAISICGWARSKSTVVNTFPHSRARVCVRWCVCDGVCAVVCVRWCVCGGVCAVAVRGWGSCRAYRTASERLLSQRESSSGHAPANIEGENRAAGFGQPESAGWCGPGVWRVACGVWRVRPSRQDRRWLEMNSSEASKTRTKWCSSFPYRAPARPHPMPPHPCACDECEASCE